MEVNELCVKNRQTVCIAAVAGVRRVRLYKSAGFANSRTDARGYAGADHAHVGAAYAHAVAG